MDFTVLPTILDGGYAFLDTCLSIKYPQMFSINFHDI